MFSKSILLCCFILFFQSLNAQTTRIEFEADEVYPEGIAYDATRDVFYVSSVYLGKIGKVDRQGNYSVVLEDTSLKSTFGMKLDAAQRMLWVCAGDPNYSKFRDSLTYKKMIRLIGIDLSKQQKTVDIDLSTLFAGKHFANDLSLDKDGNIYITDSYSPVIYKVGTDGHASVFAQSDWFGSAGTGLNGIVYHPNGYLIVANNGSGCLLKVDISDPARITKIRVDQFFPGADGLLMDPQNNLYLVQNKEVNKIFRLTSSDNWMTGKVTGATSAEDRFYFPSTTTFRGAEVWAINAKLNEISEPHKFLSKKFTLQQVVVRPAN